MADLIKEAPILISKIPIELKAVVFDTKSVETSQEAYLKVNKKYQRLSASKELDITKSITEYVCPDGSTGYHIMLEKEVDKKKYSKMIGYGPEKESRTHDWAEIINEI